MIKSQRLKKIFNSNDWMNSSYFSLILFQTSGPISVIQSEFTTLSHKIEYDRMRLTLNRAQLQQILSIVRLYQELASGYKETEASS